MNAYLAVPNNRYLSNASLHQGGERRNKGRDISTDAVSYYSSVREWKQGKTFAAETNSRDIMGV